MGGAQAMGGAVTMNAVGNSGVTGQAQFMDHGQGQTMVTVNLTAQGSSHAQRPHPPGHLRRARRRWWRRCRT